MTVDVTFFILAILICRLSYPSSCFSQLIERTHCNSSKPANTHPLTKMDITEEQMVQNVPTRAAVIDNCGDENTAPSKLNSRPKDVVSSQKRMDKFVNTKEEPWEIHCGIEQ